VNLYLEHSLIQGKYITDIKYGDEKQLSLLIKLMKESC